MAADIKEEDDEDDPNHPVKIEMSQMNTPAQEERQHYLQQQQQNHPYPTYRQELANVDRSGTQPYYYHDSSSNENTSTRLVESHQPER